MSPARDQYARLQGLAKILFIVPENEIVDRLVLATPLFLYPALSANSSTRLVIEASAWASLAVETAGFTGRCR